MINKITTQNGRAINCQFLLLLLVQNAKNIYINMEPLYLPLKKPQINRTLGGKGRHIDDTA